MNTKTRTCLIPCAATMIVAAQAALAAGNLELIFSEVPDHPSSIVPGAVDADGNPVETRFRQMEALSGSQSGDQWILRARNLLGSDLETTLLLGAGGSGTVFAQEGQPIPDGAAGEVYDFFGSSPPHFNDHGHFVYTARARGGVSANAQKGIYFDGTLFHVVRQQGDPALGLIDLPPNPSGDELFGNSFGSMHLQNDGTIGYQDGTITNIHSSRRPAVFYNDTAFLQAGVSPIEGSTWQSLDSNAFWTTPDGTRWIARGDDMGATTADDILVVDGSVVLREGSTIVAADVTIADIFQTKLAGNGDWFSRGDDPSDNDWAVRSGTLIAATGDSVVGGAETWGAVFLAFTGNRVGDWVLAGSTSSADPAADAVIVLNGTQVLVREGDPVDLDGNGMFDDDAYIGQGNNALTAFSADNLFLSDDRVVYFMTYLHNGAGENLSIDGSVGNAVMRFVVCPSDFDGSGDVGFGDLLQLLGAWGPCPGCPEDLDGSGDVGFSDLLALLGDWGPC